MGLSYSDVRAIVEDVLREVEAETEIVVLRARVAELETQIAGAVDATGAVEQVARAGLPSV